MLPFTSIARFPFNLISMEQQAAPAKIKQTRLTYTLRIFGFS